MVQRRRRILAKRGAPHGSNALSLRAGVNRSPLRAADPAFGAVCTASVSGGFHHSPQTHQDIHWLIPRGSASSMHRPGSELWLLRGGPRCPAAIGVKAREALAFGQAAAIDAGHVGVPYCGQTSVVKGR